MIHKLSDLEESQRIAASVVAKYRAEIGAIREKEKLEKRAGVLQSFQEGRYGEIIDRMQGVDPAEIIDIQIAFAVGESYRHANRLAEAAEYYRMVIEAPRPGRMLDDAIFWRAESLLLGGKISQATALFERIFKRRRGNFVKSAKRRLASIRKGEMR